MRHIDSTHTILGHTLTIREWFRLLPNGTSQFLYLEVIG